MKADNDNSIPFKALDNLPLFAGDQEIAIAVVGKKHATHWRQLVLPELERIGFPIADTAHLGRAVPLVRRFYEAYFGITAGFAMAKPSGEKKTWVPKRQRKTS